MTIRVTIESLTQEQYNAILDYYNAHKRMEHMPLERLNRAEGGFQILLEPRLCKDEINTNYKIKQLRWSHMRLVQYSTFPCFDQDEAHMLFEAMRSVLPDDVFLE